LGVVCLQRGDYERADHCFEQGLALCRELGDRRNSAAMLSNLGESARLRGDFPAAVGFYEKALVISRQIGSRESELIYLSNLSGARLGLQQFEQAEAGLRELIPLATTRTSSILSEAFSFLCEACLGQNKFREALEAARSALALARKSGNELDVGIAWRVLGRAAARLNSSGADTPIGIESNGPDTEPAACFAESLALFRKIHAEAEQARTLRAWAAFDLREGRMEQGWKKAEAAKRLFQRLRMTSELQISAARSPYDTH
jgi:tetratricopeptide (TPR) repeat protein